MSVYLVMYSTELCIGAALIIGIGIGALVMKEYLWAKTESRVQALELQRQPRAANGRYVRRMAV